MISIRRWYVFLVCAVSLQSVTWAVIALLRNLLAQRSEAPITAIAFQIAVIIIGLPLFLVHWLWAQRLAGRDPDERESALRRLYLYGTLAGFLGPFAANTFTLAAQLLRLAFGDGRPDLGFSPLPRPAEPIGDWLVAMGVLALLWFYHYRIVSSDAKAAPETGNAAAVRRLYVFGFSAAGLTMTTTAIIHLLRWIMFQFGQGDAIGGMGSGGLTDEAARMIVGLPLWLIFWGAAQRLFGGASEEERESALRKFYLYVTVFVAVLGAVSNTTIILAGLLRRLLGLPPTGDIRTPLPIVIGMAVLWAYHAYVLRDDADRAGEAPRQAGVRRLYLYLVAAVGLAAFLVGLSGDISVLIRSLAEVLFGEALKEQLAWFTAALIAGLPVWLLPWRRAQVGAVDMTPAGAGERRSVVRKIYLYFYLFVATMTVLSSAVYIVYRILSLVLGERGGGNLLSDLAQAIAFTLIGVGLWLYHGSALRGDGQLNRREQAGRLAELRVAVVDIGVGRFGRAVLEGLRRELPGLALDPIGLTPSASAAMEAAQENIMARLAEAKLIVGPWVIAVAGGADGAVTAEVAGAIAVSPARKLLAPVWAEGWEWAGVDRWNSEALVRQTVQAVKQLAAGEEVKAVRPLGVGAIIGIIIGVIVLLNLLAAPIMYFFGN